MMITGQFALSANRKIVAAPVPRAAPVQGRPLYATCLVVKAERDYASLEDTFGGRLGFTVDDSHSGYNALRHHLDGVVRRREDDLEALHDEHARVVKDLQHLEVSVGHLTLEADQPGVMVSDEAPKLKAAHARHDDVGEHEIDGLRPIERDDRVFC